MKYKITFQYDTKSAKEFARDFTIWLVDNELVLEFDTPTDWNEISDQILNSDIVIDNTTYKVIEYWIKIDKNQIDKCFSIRNIDDVEEIDDYTNYGVNFNSSKYSSLPL